MGSEWSSVDVAQFSTDLVCCTVDEEFTTREGTITPHPRSLTELCSPRLALFQADSYTAGEERLLQDEWEEPNPDWQTVERQLRSEMPPSRVTLSLRLGGSAPAYDAVAGQQVR